MNAFVQRHRESVIGILHGFDRVRIRGTLRWLCYPEGLAKHLSKMHVLLKDFKDYVQEFTERVRGGIQRVAQAAGRPVEYLASPGVSKEARARQIAERDGITQGLIGVLSAVEPCRSFEIYRNRTTRRLELRSALRKCLHYYSYWLDPEWGFYHARVQTWLPLTIHVCLNGREWLARQMDGSGVAYLRRDNCFAWLGDVAGAQRLADEQLRVDWQAALNRRLAQFHPAARELFPGCPAGYYWSIEESEWASDVLFRSAADLARLYPHLIQHATTHLGSREVLRFLGRRVPEAGGVPAGFAGEVVSDLRAVHTPAAVRDGGRRWEGLRVKHRVNRNSVKMYDKQGSVLRIETTLNDARDMRVYRAKEGQPDGRPAWRTLRKAVADVSRRAQVCQAANERYLESLAAVDDCSTTLGALTHAVCRPRRWQGRRVRALNPLGAEDAQLLSAVSRGEFALNGFRNRDLRRLLYGANECDGLTRRRQTSAVTRKLRLLRAHGLIRKVSRTHRYTLTRNGIKIITALLAAQAANTSKLIDAA